MRKLEGITKEIVDEMDYLKRREERFTDTNSPSLCVLTRLLFIVPSLDKPASAKLCLVHDSLAGSSGRMADFAFTILLQTQVSHRLSIHSSLHVSFALLYQSNPYCSTLCTDFR